MPRSDNLYSRFVSLAKITLPILGLALLSSLFLFSNSSDIEESIPYSEVELEEIVEGQLIATPVFQSVLSNGDSLTVTAQSARPDLLNPSRFYAKEIEAELSQPDGSVIELRGAEGTLDNDEDVAEVSGGIRLSHSEGYVLTSSGLRAKTKEYFAETTGPILLQGSGFVLNADHAEIRRRDGNGEVVVFTGGVKLIYEPK